MYLGLLLAMVWAAWMLGWLSPRRPWTETTGWHRIPESSRPPEAALSGEPWIRWHGQTILLDPNLSGHCTVSRRIMERPPALAGIGPVSVLISHAHFDHLNVDTLEGLDDLSSVTIPDGSEVFLERISARGIAVIPARQDQTYRIGALRVTPVPAAHNGNRFHPLRSTFAAVGYMISAPDGMTLYYAGDTAYANPWEELRDRFHPDLAILPIGAYAPRFPLKHHHLNPEEAVMAARRLGVGKVIPCHFGTFTLSFDRPASALPRFAEAAKAERLNWAMPDFMDARELASLGAMVHEVPVPAIPVVSSTDAPEGGHP
jgi:L-ascorbate metabolism protein UlaG (beta-lactamase superfamily)